MSWYIVPMANGADFQVDGEVYTDYWYANGDRIALLAGRQLEGPLVRHEILHVLSQRGDHPRGAFDEHFGGVVECGDGCDGPGEAGQGVPETARGSYRVRSRSR